MGERLLCKQEVVGSIPSGSTNSIVRYRPTAYLSERDSRRRMDAGAQFAANSAIESLAKSQVLRVLVSEPARIFYIVKRGLTWGFSSRNATQVSL